MGKSKPQRASRDQPAPSAAAVTPSTTAMPLAVGSAAALGTAGGALRTGVTTPGEVSTSGRQSSLGDGLETAKLLLAGGVAGAVSKTATAPLARLTILYQVHGMQTGEGKGIRHMHMGEAFRRIIRSEGVKALWKGNGVTIIHRLPYSAVNFWAYERFTEMWNRHFSQHPALAPGHNDILRRLTAGGAAGMCACTLAYPLDLVRTRLAAQTSSTYYQGITGSLATIVRDEGLLGLYRGLGPTLIQVAPSLAINYCTYETLRSQWFAYHQTQMKGSVASLLAGSLLCGSMAGLVSSTATFPLDLVRRRMQLEGQRGQQTRYHRMSEMFKDVLRKDGIRGLYAGIIPEYTKVIPGVAIAFCSYELMKKMLGVQVNLTNR